jgi:hypothetical protein
MKTIIFTLLLFAVTCVSASAQNKCGQTVELKYSNFTFCIPTGWKQLPREPQETYDNFGGPNPGEVLGVTSNYGDSVLKKVVDRAVNEALGSKDPAITNVTVASRNPFTTDSRVESEKVVFSAAIAGREYLITIYIHDRSHRSRGV